MTTAKSFDPKPSIDLNGKGVLITGGTGSFGRAFVRRVLELYEPSRLVIYSRDEQKQVAMEQEFSAKQYPCLRYFVGDVRDEARLRRAMSGIDVVIHAAALKHVPVAEYNPIETIKTNIFGAENLINACLDKGVERVIALSTDKAANPINLYGATKLCSDKLFVAANNLVGAAEGKFAIVRYGNVLGSRGSVIPMFHSLMAQNVERLPITDERMTRFWITIRQGVNFVFQCLGEMQGGEIFIPKIPSMKLLDVVNAIAPGYPVEIVGIRPGEKLHESMITPDDANSTLSFENCYVIRPNSIPKLKDHAYSVFGADGTPVPDDFQYRSDLNDWWLEPEQFEALLAELDDTAHA